MYPAEFSYEAPASVADAVRLLAQHGDDAKLLAGGHSLLPAMKLRLAQPKVIVDLGRIDGLSGIRLDGDSLVIGARATHSQIEKSPIVAEHAAWIAAVASAIGDDQVRHRGTMGGSLAHADPAGDWPAVALALDAQFTVVGPNGQRTVAARDFFVDVFTTALAPTEVLTEIRFPRVGRRGAYEKVRNRASGYAIVGIAVVADVSGGAFQSVAIGITGAAGKPSRATAAEAALTGKPVTADNIQAAAALAPQGLDCLDDMHGSAAYRAHLVEVHTRRALARVTGA